MIIIITLIILIIITKVRLKVVNINNDTDVCLKIGIIQINMDYDMFINRINQLDIKNKFSYKDFKQGIGIYKVIKNIINNSSVNVKKINIIKKNNNYDFYNIYLNVSYYSLGNFIKSYIYANTKKYNNISFVVLPNKSNDLDFDIDIEFSLIMFVKSLLFNLKNIIKLKRI